jgi:hypothetical protein
MANHKRKRPKNRRSGCLMCKFWKINGFSKYNPEYERHSDHLRRISAKKEAEDVDFVPKIEKNDEKDDI